MPLVGSVTSSIAILTVAPLEIAAAESILMIKFVDLMFTIHLGLKVYPEGVDTPLNQQGIDYPK